MVMGFASLGCGGGLIVGIVGRWVGTIVKLVLGQL